MVGRGTAGNAGGRNCRYPIADAVKHQDGNIQNAFERYPRGKERRLVLQLTNADLPAFWKGGETAAASGQRWTLTYTRGRLFGAVMAALGGAWALETERVDISAWVIAAGF